ncbi:collagen alpha-2(IV) chain-like [Clytia hemisphaerica]
MWEGYSLMYTVGNGQAHAQDLGDAGSCVRSFSTLPFLFCEMTGNCQYANRNDFVYWLSGDIRNTPMTPVSNAVIEPYVSRCSVCKAPDISIAVHSQDTIEPVCPKGYDSVWDGYSFLMVAGAGKTGAGQPLSSTGSCLEKFRPQPFLECQGSRGTCAFFSDKFSFWLTTIEPTKEFEIPEPKVLDTNKGDQLTNRVSRCKVCLRVPRSNRPDSPNSAPANKDASSLLDRVARRIRNWF